MKRIRKVLRKLGALLSKRIINGLNPIIFKFYISKDKFKEYQEKKLPRKAIFNTVNTCNANCVFCAYQYKRDESLIMSNEIFTEFTEQFGRLNPEGWVTLSPTVGDPLVDPDLFEKIRILKEVPFPKVQFYTNGILLNKKGNIDKILQSSLDLLIISFPDFNEEEYRKIFRTDQYLSSMEGIHELLAKHKKLDSNLGVSINLRPARPIEVIKKENDFKKFIQPYLSPRVILSYMKSFDNWTGLIKPGDLPPGMVLSKDRKRKNPIPCRRLFDVMFLATGDVKLCGCRFNGTVFDDLMIGNIKNNTLEEIWFGVKAMTIRENFFDYEYPSICLDCSLYKPVLFNQLFKKWGVPKKELEQQNILFLEDGIDCIKQLFVKSV